MQFIPNALRFSPASVGALIDPAFLRSVLRDAEAPTHPDAALAAAAQASAHVVPWYAPLATARRRAAQVLGHVRGRVPGAWRLPHRAAPESAAPLKRSA